MNNIIAECYTTIVSPIKVLHPNQVVHVVQEPVIPLSVNGSSPSIHDVHHHGEVLRDGHALFRNDDVLDNVLGQGGAMQGEDRSP